MKAITAVCGSRPYHLFKTIKGEDYLATSTKDAGYFSTSTNGAGQFPTSTQGAGHCFTSAEGAGYLSASTQDAEYISTSAEGAQYTSPGQRPGFNAPTVQGLKARFIPPGLNPFNHFMIQPLNLKLKLKV